MNDLQLRIKYAMNKDIKPKHGTVYWAAKNNYTLIQVEWQDDELDERFLLSWKAFATREEGLLGLGLACESNDD